MLDIVHGIFRVVETGDEAACGGDSNDGFADPDREALRDFTPKQTLETEIKRSILQDARLTSCTPWSSEDAIVRILQDGEEGVESVDMSQRRGGGVATTAHSISRNGSVALLGGAVKHGHINAFSTGPSTIMCASAIFECALVFRFS